ncbi:MAG: hypothetical protein U1F77_02420 [Kiritimatiellia bacterium]
MLLGLPLAWGMHKLTGGAPLPFAALALLLTVLAIPRATARKSGGAGRTTAASSPTSGWSSRSA